MAMNPKVTRKQVNAGYPYRICCGYCDLQDLLDDSLKIGHTERLEGWGADVYQIDSATCIVTGYAPFGNVRASYDLCRKYNDLAMNQKEIWWKERNYDYEEQKRWRHKTLKDFCAEAIALSK